MIFSYTVDVVGEMNGQDNIILNEAVSLTFIEFILTIERYLYIIGGTYPSFEKIMVRLITVILFILLTGYQELDNKSIFNRIRSA